VFNASLKTPQPLVTLASSRDRRDQASVSEVIALHVPSESDILSLLLKITIEGLSGDATTIKHKQSDLSQEEGVRQKRLHSQNSVQNHQPPSHQPLNKELSPAGNVQEPILSAVEMYDAGPQEKSTFGATLSSENQPLESSTNLNL
jgi:hypothetical protein